MGKYLQNVCLNLLLQFKQITFKSKWKCSNTSVLTAISGANTQQYIKKINTICTWLFFLCDIITPERKIYCHTDTNAIDKLEAYKQKGIVSLKVVLCWVTFQYLTSKINYKEFTPNRLRVFSG